MIIACLKYGNYSFNTIDSRVHPVLWAVADGKCEKEKRKIVT
jgi:hypothetical protein